MTFDVLYDPWIPVTTREGTAEKLGILPLLKNAHTLSTISSASPLVEYGIYRLLCAFVMDMLRPETDEDLEDLLEEGYFSEKRIEAYRAECMADGASFDLFDAKRPFLQCAYDSRWDSEKNIKPVSQLNQTLPHGNNHMLFEHQPLCDYRFSPAEAAQYLCTVSYFCTSGTDGPSYVNGSPPPLYVLPLGESLFETLVYSMIPLNAVSIPYAEPPIFWRSKDLVEPDRKLASTSLLFGMTLPTRRIRLIPEEDGSVKRVYYQKGLNYLGYKAWTDPHVAYLDTEKGRSSLNPQPEKDIWRNTGYLIGDENVARGRHYKAPLVIQQYRQIGRSQILRMGAYGVATKQAKCQTTQRAELRYPRELLDNEYGRQIISAGLQDVENCARALKYALQKMCDGTGQSDAVAAQCLTNYYASCQTLFWSRLCPQAAKADINSDISHEIRPNWLEKICHVAKEEFNRSADAIAMGGRYLILRSEAERGLFVALKKIRKGVE